MKKYIKRHDRVFAQVHLYHMQTLGVKLRKEQWYKHARKPVEMIITSKEAILWNEKVQTDRTISDNNRSPLSIAMRSEHVC